MTGRLYTERDLTEWLEATGRTPTPPYVDALLARTARTRQRPAWRLPERWLPMDFSLQAPAIAGRHVPFRAVAVVALVLLTLVVGALLVGSSSRRLPRPYGPAANGVIVYAAPEGEAWKTTSAFTLPMGDIMTVDPVNGISKTLVGGPTLDGYPIPSLDGTSVAFVREVPGGRHLLTVDIRGGDPKPLTKEPLPTITDAEWSPDGAAIAFTSVRDGRSSLWIADADGSGARLVDLGRDVSVVLPKWRPTEGHDILLVGSVNPSPGFLPANGYRDLWGGVDGTGTGIGLFLVRPDGTELRAITGTDGTGTDYSLVAWTPDGTRILTQRTDPATGFMTVYVLGSDGTEIGAIRPTTGELTLQPIVSPDGSRVAYADMTGSESWQIRVSPLDGSADPIEVGQSIGGGAAAFRWSPDGRTIVMTHHYYKATWLLDVAGGPDQATPWVDMGYLAWQRVAAP